jgi:hypothetical protein
MRRSLAVLAVLLVACKGNENKPIDKTDTAGAGSSPTPALADSFEKGLDSLEDLRARMCACTDVPCTDKVFEEFKAWRVNIRKDNPGMRPSKEQEKKGNAIDKAMRACRANVTAKPGSATGGEPPKDPIEAGLVELAAFKAKMCACKDKACADALQTDYATWQRNLRTKVAEKPNKQQEARGTVIENEMKECRKKAELATPGASGGGAAIDAMLGQMQTFRDKICACTTKDCATKLQAEMKTWRDQVGKSVADAKPTQDQDARAGRLNAELKACAGKL